MYGQERDHPRNRLREAMVFLLEIQVIRTLLSEIFSAGKALLLLIPSTHSAIQSA